MPHADAAVSPLLIQGRSGPLTDDTASSNLNSVGQRALIGSGSILEEGTCSKYFPWSVV